MSRCFLGEVGEVKSREGVKEEEIILCFLLKAFSGAAENQSSSLASNNPVPFLFLPSFSSSSSPSSSSSSSPIPFSF